jgi:hypothetical protein
LHDIIFLVLYLRKLYLESHLFRNTYFNITGVGMMEKEKIVLFAFRGDPMCFIHVLLNALDLHERGREGLIVIEGETVKLVPKMSNPSHFLATHYHKVKSLGLITAVCKACSTKLGVSDAVEREGLPLTGDMSGHPSMGAFLEKGYRIITF